MFIKLNAANGKQASLDPTEVVAVHDYGSTVGVYLRGGALLVMNGSYATVLAAIEKHQKQ